MDRERTAVLVLVGVIALAGVPTAAAGTPGHWTQITDATATNIDEVAVARTADSTLHTVWIRPNPSNPGGGTDLLERSISASGSVGSSVVLASNWATMSNPAEVATGGNGLAVFLGATRSTSPTETISNLARFTSADGGTHWTLDPTDLTDTGAAAGSDTAAAIGSGGTPFITWGSSSCLCVHRGVTTSANVDFQQGLGDFGYDPGIALDQASGQLVAAWYSNGTGHKGVYAATVDQSTGARSGTPLRMPGTSTLLDGPFSGHTQIAGRAGGGLYVAYEAGYPSHTRVLLWRVGAGSSTLIGKSTSGVSSVGVASTPTGRLWAFWASRSSSGKPIVHARRSNGAATAWGASVVVTPPHGASESWNLVGDGQDNRLDLLGSFSLGSSSNAATWHTQVLPGLSFSASPTHLRVGASHAKKIAFVVSDAGAPLSGARVRIGGVNGTTNGKGKVTLALGPFAHKAHLHARASLKGYVAATLTLKVG